MNNIQTNLDLIELLRLIRTAIYSGTISKKSTLTYIEAETSLMNYCQGNKTGRSKYLEVFSNKTEVYKLFGGEPGTSDDRVTVQIVTNGIVPASTTDKKFRALRIKPEKSINLFFYQEL